MKKEQELVTLRNASASLDFDLGTWLGRRQAFSMMAGKASAADIECLRTIRDQRLYKSKQERWKDFCTEHVGASKAQVDRLIRYLEEFGPSFFELTSVARITPDTYRLIAKHVSGKGLRLDGQVIPLTQENSPRISAAVAELRKRAAPPPTVKAAPLSMPAASRIVEFAALAIHFEDVIECLGRMQSLDKGQQSDLAVDLATLHKNVVRLGMERFW